MALLRRNKQTNTYKVHIIHSNIFYYIHIHIGNSHTPNRRAEQTFARIRLLDQLPEVDLLPAAASHTRQVISMFPTSRDPVLCTPLFLWYNCVILLPLVTQGQSPGRLTLGESEAGDMLLVVFP